MNKTFNWHKYKEGKTYDLHYKEELGGVLLLDTSSADWELVPSEVVYTKWGDMTPEQKGEILLAQHEGKAIEHSNFGEIFNKKCSDSFYNSYFYRVREEETVAPITLFVAINRSTGNIIRVSEDESSITAMGYTDIRKLVEDLN